MMTCPFETPEQKAIREAGEEGARLARESVEKWVRTVKDAHISVSATCPKCGGKTTRTYHDGTDYRCMIGFIQLRTTSHEEHLHHYCTDCGYDWVGPVLGKVLEGKAT